MARRHGVSSAATPIEQAALQDAIRRALEKEAKEKGLTEASKVKITYLAIFQVGSKQKELRTENREAFVAAVKRIQNRFPKMTVTIFEIEERL